jgi:hypothetical protein
MATKTVLPAKPKKPAKSKSSAAKTAKATRYQVVLRELDGTTLTTEVEDQALYPQAVAWNNLLSSDRGRQINQDKEAAAWRSNAHEAILELAASGGVTRTQAAGFIKAAAKSGVVQIETVWRRETAGWAARVFPWEALLALATKDERKRIGQSDFMVVRRLTGGTHPEAAKGKPAFAVSEGAEMQGFDYATERAAIEAALQSPLQTLCARSLAELASEVKAKQPKIVHLVLNSAEKGVAISAADLERLDEPRTGKLAEAVASHGP